MRLVVALITVVLALAVTAAVARAGEAKTAGGHSVRWDAGLEEMGERVVRRIPEVRGQVEHALGFAFPGGPAQIVIVRGLERMREETGAAVPEWAAAVCQGGRSLIVMRADRVDQTPLSPMVTTLRHEWVHLAWARRAALRVRTLPLWLEEGLAEDIGGGVSIEAGSRLDFAARFGWLLDFDSITTRWPADAGQASLAYKQGTSFVRFYRRQHGPEALRNLLRDLADGRGHDTTPHAGPHFDQLVAAQTGAPLSQWLAAWQVDVKAQADPWFHLIWRDFQSTIWIVVALISVVGFFVLRRKRRRQMDELPDDPLPYEE